MSKPLYIYSGGFLRPSLRAILRAAGYRLTTGWPSSKAHIAVWGQGKASRRGAALAQQTGATLVRFEDAFLRSVRTGREGAPSLGLLIDETGGIHYDPRAPSALETLLASHPLDDPSLLARAARARADILALGLSKYNAHLPQDWTRQDHVVLLDQTAGDAALKVTGATRATFLTMLEDARRAHPGAKIIVKAHPETLAHQRKGHFTPEDLRPGEEFCTLPLAPQQLFKDARAVYTVSSQMGFEAIWAGLRPQVYGGPFYAGWGLSEDRLTFPRRARPLTIDQLFAAAMILAPLYYCPYRQRLATLEETILTLEAQRRAWQEDHAGWEAYGMRLWKRGPLQRAFGGNLRFKPSGQNRRAMVWANQAHLAPKGAARLEDGFIRSKGLGADLVPPASLVLDDLGIYYDPSAPSRLEALISAPPPDLTRATRLLELLRAQALSKYNLPSAPLPALGQGRRILVPGQVEDDASIRLGAGGAICTNEALLAAVRAANPDAILLWKPHPDVEAGLRPGKVEAPELYADVTLDKVSAPDAIAAVDEIWTMTSTIGFEALVRGKKVVTFGAPFYAGWGLTEDLGAIPERRQARPSLLAFIHAVLIAYPRYFDPDTGAPAPPEVVLEKLARQSAPKRSLANRLLAKTQGALASYAWIWRQR